MSNLRAESVSPQQVTRDGVDETVCQVVLHIPEADANRLAQHYTDRDAEGLPVLAAEAKESATPLYKALADAGYGLG
jgi:hypothetical protein